MPSPWLKATAAAWPRVSGPVVKVLTLRPRPNAGRGCGGGRAQPRARVGGVSVRRRWGDASFWRPSWGSPSSPLEAPVRDEETSICSRPCRTRSRRAAIPSESSSSSSSSFLSSSSGESSSGSPHASTWLDVPRVLVA